MRARANRFRQLAAALVAALAALTFSPAAALACPQCAGREDGGWAQGLMLGSFVLLPFAIVWVVYRFIRSESAGGASGAHSRLRT